MSRRFQSSFHSLKTGASVYAGADLTEDMTNGYTDGVRAEIHHRPAVSGSGYVRRVEEILDEVREAGSVGTVEEYAWSPEEPASAGSMAFEKYRVFTEWADRNGVSVEPPFEVRKRDSRLLEESGEVLLTPVVCLAVYFDDTLLAVFPHTEDDETVSVDEGLAEIDAERRVVIRGDEVDREPVAVPEG